MDEEANKMDDILSEAFSTGLLHAILAKSQTGIKL